MADALNIDDNRNLCGFLNLQLTEIEILQSMFEEGKELCIEYDVLAQIQEYLSQSSDFIPNLMTFTVKLYDTGQENCNHLQVNFCFPHKYPQELPEVHVKCDSLTREAQRHINHLTVDYLATLEKGELCTVTIIQWLQETWPEYCERYTQSIPYNRQEKHEMESKEQANCEPKLSRIWLYMHHIYSKTKRKHILDWAHDFKLTGFSLPGKPGVVCIEGDSRDTEEYCSRLRRLNWKKIQCRHKEERLQERKFSDFKELVFNIHGSSDDRMDFGEFFQYLLEHDLGEMFKILFGIDGKLNSNC